MMRQRFWKLFALMLIPIVSSGCLALALGAAGTAIGVSYVKGNLVDRLESPVTEVYAAAVAVIQDEGLPLYETELRTSDATVRSEYLDDKNIRIEIVAISSNASKITIRVGVSGNQTRSIHLLDAIRARL